MSFYVVATVMRTRFGNSQRKCIALKLADCANDDGTSIFPAKETIVEHSEAGRTTVYRAINEWVECGLLERVGSNGNGGRKTTEYRFNMPLLESLAAGDCEFVREKNGSREPAWVIRRCENFVENDAKTSPKVPSRSGTSRGVRGTGPGLTRPGPGFTRPGPGHNPINNLSRTEEEAREAPPPPPSLEKLFDEFADVAVRAGFIPPNAARFGAVSSEIEKIIDLIGVDGWREALELAASDPVCCGKVPAGANYTRPWRLTINKFCEPDWLLAKLDEWRAVASDMAGDRHVINRGTPQWGAWQDHFAASGNWQARYMENAKKWTVASEWPAGEAKPMPAQKGEKTCLKP